ncbi:MAG: lipopolysaccharide biosynthesis regulator YciM [Gammaproteobacteria bacterium]
MEQPLILLWLLLPLAAATGWWLGRIPRKGSHGEGSDDALRSDYFRGINYLLNEQPDKAIEVFIKVLEVDQETVETHLALGNLYRRRGEVDRAIRIHQNLVARSSLTTDQRSEALLELGQDYLTAGLLDRAEDLFKELAQTNPYRVQALRQLIDIYEQERDWDQAIESARQLEKYTGNHLGTVIAHYHCEQAERLRHNGDTAAALKLVGQALDMHRACVRASLLEGEIHASNGDHERAVRAYQRVEDQDPAYLPEIIEPIQRCLHELGRAQETRAYLSRLLERYGWVSAALELAEMQRCSDGPRAAIDFMAQQLRNRSSVRGLDRLMELEFEERGTQMPEYFHLLKGLTAELLEDRAVYKCSHCGFPARSLHWKCPSCKHWNTVKPIQGIEGE